MNRSWNFQWISLISLFLIANIWSFAQIETSLDLNIVGEPGITIQRFYGLHYPGDGCHTGVDYSGPRGTPLNSLSYGRVAFKNEMTHQPSCSPNLCRGKFDHGMGRVLDVEILLETGELIFASFNHLNGFHPFSRQDAWVVQAQKLAFMGGSGQQSDNYWGNHLHLEIRARRNAYNGNGIIAPWGYTNGSSPAICSNQANPDGEGYLNPQDYLGNDLKEVMLPFFSMTSIAPDKDNYDVFGFEGQTLFGAMNVNGGYYHVGILARNSRNRNDFDQPATSATPKYVAEAGSENNQTAPFSIDGLSGQSDEYLAGDYLFLATLTSPDFPGETRYGYPVKFSILEHANSNIVDNDQVNRGANQYLQSNTGDEHKIPGYFLSATVATGRSQSWAQWKPAIAGLYRIYVHLPKGIQANRLVYKIKGDGTDQNQILASPLNDHADGEGRWVPLTVADGNLFELTPQGFVGISLGDDANDPGDNAHLNANDLVAFDAIKFEFVSLPTASIGHYADGWRDDRHSLAFLNAYHENGGGAWLGEPHDDGGGPFVHWWGTVSSVSPSEGVWIQTFHKTAPPRYGNGETALIFNQSNRGAILVKEAFWQFYQQHHGYQNFGAPRGDEFQAGNHSFQAFKKAVLKKDGLTGIVTKHRTLGAPQEPTVPVQINSNQPGVPIYNRDTYIGMTPVQFTACEHCAYEMEAAVTTKMGTARRPFSFVADPLNPNVSIDAGSTVTVTLAGTITRPDGFPVWDVVLTGLDGNPKTDQKGRFSARVPLGWSGTIAPVKRFYTFTQPAIAITNAQNDRNDLGFTGVKLRPAIPIRVTWEGNGLEGVFLRGLSGNAVTDVSGDYVADLHVGWSGTIRPRLRGFSFDPSFVSFDYLEEDQPQIVFTAAERTSQITGSITLHGQPLPGVVMQGLPGNPQTGADGVFTATVAYEWSGTVTPSLDGFMFVPDSRTFSDVTWSRDEQDFTALPQTYAVSGTVTTNIQGNTRLEDVWLIGLPGGILTDGSGNYSGLVPHGWSETITPLKLGFNFNPPDILLPAVTNDQSGVNFSAALLPGEKRIWIVDNAPDFEYATIFADPADIIYVKPGVYDDISLSRLHDGVIIRSEAGAAQTVFNLERYYNWNENNMILDGFTLATDYAGEMIHFNGAVNAQLKNCIFKPAAGEYALRIRQSQNVLIEGCVIGDAGSRGVLLRVGNGGGQIMIRNNLFDGASTAINGGSDPHVQLTLENNIFRGNGAGVSVDEIRSVSLSNNIFENISFRALDLDAIALTTTIIQNTFVGINRAADIDANALMYNNIFKDNNQNIEGRGNENTINIHHTMHFPNGLLWCCANFIVDNDTVWNQDPLFVDQAGGDYRLSANSPAIGAGANGYDLGAYGGPNGDNWPAVPGTPEPLPALLDFQIDGPLETATGKSVPIQARSFYQDNYYSEVNAFTAWSTSDPAILEHLGEGRFLAHAPGTATVTAVFEGISRTLDIQVFDDALEVGLESVQATTTTKRGGGQELTLFIDYTNAGEGNARNVRLTVAYDSDFSFISAFPAPDAGTDNLWTLANLEPDQSGTIAVAGTIPGTLGNGAELITNVTAESDFNGDIQIVEITQIPGIPALDIQVSPDRDPVIPGETVLLNVTLSNPGSGVAHNAKFQAGYDLGIGLVTATDLPDMENNLWDLGFLEPGGQRTLTLETLVDPNLEAGTSLSNHFALSADFLPETGVSQQTTVDLPMADLAITKFGSRNQAVLDEPLTYWINVTNLGPSTATDLLLTDSVGQTANVMATSHPAVVNGGILEFELGNLEPGSGITVILVVEPLSPPSVDATVTVGAGPFDPDLNNNSLTLSTPVTEPPNGTIDQPTGDVTVTTGDTVFFSGTASDPDGNTPLTFVWNFGGGAPESTAEDPGDIVFNTEGAYPVTFTATDSLGAADPTPDNRVVNVLDNQAPDGMIDTPTADPVICTGQSVGFTATGTDVDGHMPLSYLWNFGGGASGSTAEDPGDILFHQAGTFSVTLTVTDARGLADSTPDTRTVTVREPARITTQPGEATFCPGQAVTFSVSATGTSPLTYQWRKDRVALTGKTNPTLVIDPISVADGGAYDCQVSNACGSVLSQVANLNVNEPVAIIGQPENTAVCPGGMAGFSVVAAGAGALTYQWQKGGVDIPDATSATLIINAVTANDAGDYHCEVSNLCGTVATNPATLSLKDAVAIANPPDDAVACPGDAVTLTVTATGTAPLAYQWRKNGVNISGANGMSLLIDPAASDDAGNYDCLVSNDCGSVLSPSANLTVRDPVSITNHPENAVICPGDAVTFSVATTGATPITYQWYHDGSPIAGATGPSYTLNTVTPTDEGTYDCVATNLCGSQTSVAAQLIVDGDLDVWVSPSGNAQGLSSLSLEALLFCFLPDVAFEWRYLTSGAMLGTDNPIALPLLTETTRFEVTVTDGLNRETATAGAIVLVAEDPIYLDLNGDGCNTVLDLYLLAEEWLTPRPLNDDPNADGFIDIRDFLYLNLDDPAPCDP